MEQNSLTIHTSGTTFQCTGLYEGASLTTVSPVRTENQGFLTISKSSLAGLNRLRMAQAYRPTLHPLKSTPNPPPPPPNHAPPKPRRISYYPCHREAKLLKNYTESTVFPVRGSWAEFGSKQRGGQ